MFRTVLDRLETIGQTIIRHLTAIDHRLTAIEKGNRQMTAQTQDLLNVMGSLSDNVNRMVAMETDLKTRLLAVPAVAQAVQDDPDLATAIQQAKDINARVAAALGDVAQAAAPAADSTGTTAPASIQQNADAAQAAVQAAAASDATAQPASA